MMLQGPIYQVLFLVVFFVLWIVLMRFVLPRFGLST
jgi:hypothetical protein